MPQFGGKSAKKSSSDTKRHFTVVMKGKEHGLYVSSTPSSAARKAVTKLCTANKSKKVEFSIREITQGSKKKTYGPYSGYIEKLKEPIELKGRVIKYKPIAKLSGKKGEMKGGATSLKEFTADITSGNNKYEKSFLGLGKDKIFFGIKINNQYFSIALTSDGSLDVLTQQLDILHFDSIEQLTPQVLSYVLSNKIPDDSEKFSPKIRDLLNKLRNTKAQIIQQQQQIMSENKKIILKGFNPNVWGEMKLQHQGKIFNVNIGAVVNPSSYIFVNEKENKPYGTFEDFIKNQNISSAVYREVDYNTKIVIKIGEGGSVAALLSDPNLPELNNTSGKLSTNTYQLYKSVINKIKANNLIEQEEAETRARLNPNY
jgi:hypothetical protein